MNALRVVVGRVVVENRDEVQRPESGPRGTVAHMYPTRLILSRSVPVLYLSPLLSLSTWQFRLLLSFVSHYWRYLSNFVSSPCDQGAIFPMAVAKCICRLQNLGKR